jgi:hypothetical protein
VYGGLESAIAQLRGRRFDGVLVSGVLHLLQDPTTALCYVSSLLAEHGVLVATVPAFHRLPFLWLWLQHPLRYQGWRDFQRSGVHPIDRRQAKTWFRKAGLSLEQTFGTVPQRWKTLVTSSGRGLAEAFLSREYTFVGRRVGHPGKTIADSLTQQSKIESETGYIADRSVGR